MDLYLLLFVATCSLFSYFCAGFLLAFICCVYTGCCSVVFATSACPAGFVLSRLQARSGAGFVLALWELFLRVVPLTC